MLSIESDIIPNIEQINHIMNSNKAKFLGVIKYHPAAPDNTNLVIKWDYSQKPSLFTKGIIIEQLQTLFNIDDLSDDENINIIAEDCIPDIVNKSDIVWLEYE